MGKKKEAKKDWIENKAVIREGDFCRGFSFFLFFLFLGNFFLSLFSYFSTLIFSCLLPFFLRKVFFFCSEVAGLRTDGETIFRRGKNERQHAPT